MRVGPSNHLSVSLPFLEATKRSHFYGSHFKIGVRGTIAFRMYLTACVQTKQLFREVCSPKCIFFFLFRFAHYTQFSVRFHSHPTKVLLHDDLLSHNTRNSTPPELLFFHLASISSLSKRHDALYESCHLQFPSFRVKASQVVAFCRKLDGCSKWSDCRCRDDFRDLYAC